MQTKFLIHALGVIVLASLTLSCGMDEQKKSPPDKNSVPHVEGAPACYLSHCYETVAMSQISDSAKNYVYPDPNDFPDASMRDQYIKPLALLDLQNIDPTQKLAANFRLKDFMSASKGRYGLFSSDVVTKLQLIRNSVGRAVYVNSAYRSPGYNSRIDGSARWSRHTYGDGVDIKIDGVSIAGAATLCKQQGASFTLNYSSHVHCDWRKTALDPAFYGTSSKVAPLADITAAKMIASQSEIISQSVDNQIQFKALLPVDGDEGPPLHEWTITLPNGSTIQSTDAVAVTPQMTGTYTVHVIVGGSVELDQVMTW